MAIINFNIAYLIQALLNVTDVVIQLRSGMLLAPRSVKNVTGFGIRDYY